MFQGGNAFRLEKILCLCQRSCLSGGLQLGDFYIASWCSSTHIEWKTNKQMNEMSLPLNYASQEWDGKVIVQHIYL